MMPMILRILRAWLPLVVVITGLCGLGYLAGQQVLRVGGNDPQLQGGRAAARRLSAGGPLARVGPRGTVDVGARRAVFPIVYNARGRVLASPGMLHGQPPALPGGVLDFVRENGENRRSWQPEQGQ